MSRMIRNRLQALALAALLVLSSFLAGCSLADSITGTADHSAEEGVYRIYYMNLEGTALVQQEYKAVSEDFEGRLTELLTAFMNANSTKYRSALPDTVKINSTTTGISEIIVDFSAEYLSLDSISEILLRSALVSTLIQLRGVTSIRFTVDSQALMASGHEAFDDAMASAATCQLFGGTPAQVEYAAEMGLEHHLGMTCDPVCGLVQIPCIERNAFAAARALDADIYATFSDGFHRVSFDQVVEAMKQTGHDLPSLYKETGAGGLAKGKWGAAE